jgi:hypothetical protein
VQIRTVAHCLTSGFEVFEEFADIHSIGSDFIHALLCSLQNHNLELFKPVGIVTVSVKVGRSVGRSVGQSVSQSWY